MGICGEVYGRITAVQVSFWALSWV